MPPQIVTARADGTEDHWQYSHSVADRDETAEERWPTVNAGDTDEWTSCEWMTTSGYRCGTCGRGAKRNRYGLSLCWQHEDAAFAHIIHNLKSGRYYAKQTDDLAAAILENVHLRAGMSSHSPILRLLTKELRNHLQALIDGAHIAPDLSGLIDQLIAKRLQHNWGRA
jgi:hypothetical protein